MDLGKRRRLARPVRGIQYVDDGFWYIVAALYTVASTIICLFWSIVGSEVGFQKLRANSRSESCIGIRVEADKEPKFWIDDRKIAAIKSLLQGIVAEGSISEKRLSKLTGKLSNLSQLLPYIRPYTQPYYGLLSVLRSRALPFARCPPTSEISIISAFLLKLIAKYLPSHPVGSVRRNMLRKQPIILIAVDASLAALGGFITLAGRGTARHHPAVKWFSCSLKTEDLGVWRCLLKDKSLPEESRNMVAFELLAACLGLRLAEKEYAGLQKHNVVLLTDNEATRGILSKMYAKTAALAKLLRCMTETLASLSDHNFFPTRIASEHNIVADRISRGQLTEVPAEWERAEIDLRAELHQMS